MLLSLHLVEGGVLGRLAALGQQGFDAAEAPLEFGVGLAQTVFGIDVVRAGETFNRGVVFPDDPTKKRSEDDLIAYSRVRFIDTKDPEWLVRLAMVKSGVRAMDAVQEFMKSGQKVIPPGLVEPHDYGLPGSRRRTKPMVAAVHGAAIGAGLGLALVAHVCNACGWVPSAANCPDGGAVLSVDLGASLQGPSPAAAA